MKTIFNRTNVFAFAKSMALIFLLAGCSQKEDLPVVENNNNDAQRLTNYFMNVGANSYPRTFVVVQGSCPVGTLRAPSVSTPGVNYLGAGLTVNGSTIGGSSTTFTFAINTTYKIYPVVSAGIPKVALQVNFNNTFLQDNTLANYSFITGSWTGIAGSGGTFSTFGFSSIPPSCQ